MTDSTSEVAEAESVSEKPPLLSTNALQTALTVTSFLGAFGLVALAVWSAGAAKDLLRLDIVWFWSLFSACIGGPLLAAYILAVRELKLPALSRDARPDSLKGHVTGWGGLLLLLAVSGIVLLAFWAGSSREHAAAVQSTWGIGIVVALSAAFIAVALGPVIPWGEIGRRAARILDVIGYGLRPLGWLLSTVDSLLVFAVVPAVGASQGSIWLRYFLLALFILPCLAMGFYLPTPMGLLPAAIVFVIAVSISRRWAWIEDDRELAMLNGKFSGDHLRVGFDQDLRDEALIGFMSMFLVVPIALRQFESLATAYGIELFTIQKDVDPSSLWPWIAFYGNELAKAVPFVDWAEIYNVQGQTLIRAVTDESRHLVFATRVLVDLVFLAALLQAFSILSRNAKQQQLFRKGDLPRLDPFTEPNAFRALAYKDDNGAVAVREDLVQSFPVYEKARLVVLSEDRDQLIAAAAKALRRRQGDLSIDDLQDRLLELALKKTIDPNAIDDVIVAIKAAGSERDIDKLSEARIHLNGNRTANDVRLRIADLIIAAPDSPDRKSAIIAMVGGPSRDRTYKIRGKALEALKPLAQGRDQDSIDAIRKIGADDAAGALASDASQFLSRLFSPGPH